MIVRTVSLAIVAALSLSLVACSSNTDGEESAATDDAAITAPAQVSCGAAKYNEAFAFYKKAVDGANARARTEMCDWESNDEYLYEISANALRAVDTCAAFQNVIKTSKWAGNLRTALEGTLSYEIVTGEVDPGTWSGLSSALVGVKMDGGMGHSDVWRLEFQADGRGTMMVHVFDEETWESRWEDKPIGWAVEQRDAQTFLRISGQAEGGSEIGYDYLLKNAGTEAAPQFILERQGEWNDAFPATERFYDIPGECGG